MNKILVCVAAALMALAGQAIAADMPLKAPAYAPTTSWTSCYVGAGGGYGMADIDHNVTNATNTATFDIGHDNAARGWFGTVGVGCDFQMAERWVIGAFADWDWTGIKGQYSFNCPGGCAGPTGYRGELKEHSVWSVGGRLGYVVMPKLLVFVSGGWTEARFSEVNYVDGATGAVSNLQLPRQTVQGYFFGTGYEYALGWLPNLFWKTEYRYSSFDGVDRAQICLVTGSCGTAGTTHSNDHSRTHQHSVRSELVWRFRY